MVIEKLKKAEFKTPEFKKPDLKTISGAIVVIQALSAVILFQIFIVYILHATREDPKYYTFDSAGSERKIKGLSKPNVSTESLLRWATLAATASHTMNFADYEEELEKLGSFYTEDGYQSYLQSLEESGFVEDIVTKKLISSAVSYGTTVIVSEGWESDGYKWDIQVPLLLTYQGASEDTTQKTMLSNMRIKTVSPRDSDRGIGIESFSDVPLGR